MVYGQACRSYPQLGSSPLKLTYPPSTRSLGGAVRPGFSVGLWLVPRSSRKRPCTAEWTIISVILQLSTYLPSLLSIRNQLILARFRIRLSPLIRHPKRVRRASTSSGVHSKSITYNPVRAFRKPRLNVSFNGHSILFFLCCIAWRIFLSSAGRIISSALHPSAQSVVPYGKHMHDVHREGSGDVELTERFELGRPQGGVRP